MASRKLCPLLLSLWRWMPGRNLWKHLNVTGFSLRYLNCNLISIFLFIHSGDETEDWIVSWILLFFLWAGIDLTFLFFLFQDLESRKSRCRSFCLIFSSTVFILLLPGIGACRSWDCFLFFLFCSFVWMCRRGHRNHQLWINLMTPALPPFFLHRFNFLMSEDRLRQRAFFSFWQVNSIGLTWVEFQI